MIIVTVTCFGTRMCFMICNLLYFIICICGQYIEYMKMYGMSTIQLVQSPSKFHQNVLLQCSPHKHTSTWLLCSCVAEELILNLWQICHMLDNVNISSESIRIQRRHMLLHYNTRVLFISDSVVCHFLLICCICDLHLYSKLNDRNWQPRVVRHNSDPLRYIWG
jgi:hypothetical protein